MANTLSAYINTLFESSAAAETRAKSEEARRQQEEAEQFAQRSMSLPDRLKRIIAAMPETERTKPRSLEWFAERLRGRQRLSPHRGELAGALRSLGWTRKRRWHESAGGFRAYWHPPVND